ESARTTAARRAARSLHDALPIFGAERVIDYRGEEFAEVVLDATGGRGADVVLDHIGAEYLPMNMKALAVGGRLALIGVMSGRKAERKSTRLNSSHVKSSYAAYCL